MAHRVSCSAACGIFPDQGSNPRPLHWEVDSQPLRHQGSPTFILLKLSQHCKINSEVIPPLLFFGVNSFYKCKVKFKVSFVGNILVANDLL